MRRKLIENRSIAVSACFVLCIQFSLLQNAVGQSNYASHANNVDYLGKGLPEEATLDGKVSKQTKNCVFFKYSDYNNKWTKKHKRQQTKQIKCIQ